MSQSDTFNGDEQNSKSSKSAAQTPPAADVLQKDKVPTVQGKAPPVKRKAHEAEELQDELKGILTPRSGKPFFAERQALPNNIRPKDRLPDDIDPKKAHFDLTKTEREVPTEDEDIALRISPDYAVLNKLTSDIATLSEILKDPTHILHTMRDVKKEHSDRVARHTALTNPAHPTDRGSPNWDHTLDAEINKILNTGAYPKRILKAVVKTLNAKHAEYNKGIGKSHKDLEHDARDATAGIVATPGEGAEASSTPRGRSSVYIPSGREQGGGPSK